MDLDPYASMQVGMRVVRGLDWKWGNQDNGEGNVGTVVEIGRQGSPTTPDKTVVVQWDQGTRTNYRTGFQGAYDLLLYDNAQIGVRHPNIICDCCKKHGIRGMRWKCKICFDYDLCMLCYMNNKHDLAHAFERYETAHSRPVTVTPRQNLPRIVLKGIFQGAKVVRGPDWEWGNQDGGENKTGRVMDIRGWDVETGRSVASVTWVDGTTNVYRVGHKGKVDLKCITEATGGFYYKEHLPKLGKPAELQKKESTERHPFQHGDKVKCLLDIDILREMQEGHGGWNPKMAEFIGQTGTVHRITDRGDVRVQFNSDIRWTFHPGALTKLNTFWVDDVVRVIDDLETVKQLQVGHGEWTDEMAAVDIKNQGRTALQVASYLGQVEVVKVLLQTHANINLRDEEGDTALHYAAFGNQAEVARVLVSKGANPDLLNNVKCTALYIAVNKGFTEVVQALCEYNCDVNLPDSYGDTPLHYAITADFKCIIEALTEVPTIDFTIPNRQGFNLLHHSALKGNKLAIKKILARARQLVDAKKEDGFTALHLAALNNHKEVAEILIKEGRCDVNLKNNRNQTPLHLAVTQGHMEMVQLLVSERCDVNAEDEDGDTAMHIVLERHNLMSLMADGQSDDEGSLFAKLRASGFLGNLELNVGAAIACYLAQEGADIHYANHRGKSPLDLVLDGSIVQLIKNFSQKFRDQQDTLESSAVPCSLRRVHTTPNTMTNLSVAKVAAPSECLVCSELALLVHFFPCQHSIVCEECSRRMKRCIKCQVTITKKVKQDSTEVERSPGSESTSQQKLMEDLQNRYRQMEERITCPICIDNQIKLVFQCGHGSCLECSASLSVCPICRQTVRERIQIFV
ncbi:E3 ubiquitin-protein ligase MIB2 isoform X2 [Eublepharis macularius]|uniref:E3 ubiquitin-protein ligase MIB2 n=1 Tax=Eublepharis macularius TaxID=481883 RepID=A0AA97KKK6_EUBMA|nr:E3 ubiquitin-protein ligase MIB2 isoform X2 [Eublepharis macularius]